MYHIIVPITAMVAKCRNGSWEGRRHRSCGVYDVCFICVCVEGFNKSNSQGNAESAMRVPNSYNLGSRPFNLVFTTLLLKNIFPMHICIHKWGSLAPATGLSCAQTIKGLAYILVQIGLGSTQKLWHKQNFMIHWWFNDALIVFVSPCFFTNANTSW